VDNPNDTDLVKDGAAAIRTLGSSVETLGDIEYRSATANTNTRLPIGSTGNVLTVAGGVPSWAAPATPAAPTTNFTLINTGGTALTGASTITISGLSGYNELYIFVDGASATAALTMSWNFNSDSSGNYARTGFWNGWAAQSYPTGAASRSAGGSNIIAGQGNAAADTVFATLRISGANSTQIKPYFSYGTGGTGANSEGWLAYGHYKGTSVISSVNLIGNANFDAGTIFVYGA
jgi:hypothetical protein